MYSTCFHCVWYPHETVRLKNLYLNVTYSRVRIGKNSSDVLPINTLKTELHPICHLLALLDHPIFQLSRVKVKKGLKQGDALSPLLFGFGLK